MKKITFIILLFITIQLQAQDKQLTVTDVENELATINVEEIKIPCDCADGMSKISTLLVKVSHKFSTRAEMEDDFVGLKTIRLTNTKIAEIALKCAKLGFKDQEIYACESFNNLKENSEILNKKFRR